LFVEDRSPPDRRRDAGQNGKQLFDQTLAERPALQVLFMTGYARDAVVHDGRLDSGIVLIQK
jgi:two-component system, NtrC family, sensor kinase